MTEILYTDILALVLMQKVELHGFSDREMSEKIGLHPSTLGKYWRGERELSVKTCVAICGELKLPFSAVVREVDDLYSLMKRNSLRQRQAASRHQFRFCRTIKRKPMI